VLYWEIENMKFPTLACPIKSLLMVYVFNYVVLSLILYYISKIITLFALLL